MNVAIYIKSVIANLLWLTGIAQLKLKSVSKQAAGILMYHRVLPSDFPKKGIQSGMYVQTDTFKKHIDFLIKRFSLVTLQDLCESQYKSKDYNKPFCALTFDDGWYDFYDQVYPILKLYRVPATVFLPTAFIGTHNMFWTDRLLNLLLKNSFNIKMKYESQFMHPLTIKLLEYKGSSLECFEEYIYQLKDCTDTEIEKILQELSCAFGISPENMGRSFLNWDEVREMLDSGLVSYGSHTVNHRILTTLNEKNIREELTASRKKLLNEKAVSKNFIPFCYPNGNTNENIERMVKEAGYSLAVSTKYGWNRSTSDMFSLNRLPVHDDITYTTPLLACHIAGIF